MALIKTVAELNKYIRIPSTNVSKLMPAMLQAEEQYLVPVLGMELYQSLSTAYEAGTLSPVQEKLLPYCQAITANMGYLSDLPFLQTNLTDQGAKVMEAEGTRSAFKWEFNAVKEGLAKNGYSAMELLILFLREKRSDYPQWASAPYNDPESAYLITDGAVLNQSSVTLQQPHRCFLMLQPLLPSIFDLQIEPSIGEEYLRHISERVQSGTIDPIEKPLVKHLRNAVARYLLAQASVELSIQFSGNGFTVVDQVKDDADDGRTAAATPQLERFRGEMNRTAAAYLDKAVQYLIKNADNAAFAMFKNSEQYPKDGIRVTDNGNDRRKGVFVT